MVKQISIDFAIWILTILMQMMIVLLSIIIFVNKELLPYVLSKVKAQNDQ